MDGVAESIRVARSKVGLPTVDHFQSDSITSYGRSRDEAKRKGLFLCLQEIAIRFALLEAYKNYHRISIDQVLFICISNGKVGIIN